MNYHLALGKSWDFAAFDRDARAAKGPRHVFWTLAQRLGAEVHMPGGDPIRPFDRVRARIAGGPQHWAMARTLAGRLGGDDLVFCSGEDVGIPVAALCGARRDRPRIVSFFHNVMRPRGRAALRLFRIADRVDLFVTNTSIQADFLRRALHLPERRLFFLPSVEQTDTRFFTPGPATTEKRRPIIASAGLEQRDYRTLAEATRDLDVDVRVTGYSKDAAVMKRAFPEPLPANMSARYYDWLELVRLYRDADLVVVSLFPNKYPGGITTILEAMSCRRPVIVTRTEGLRDYVETPGIVTTVEPGDPAGLRKAIVHLLEHPEEADAQAMRGYEIVLEWHNSERWVEVFATRLNSLLDELSPTVPSAV
ncbi:MAG: glycosyltransferase family 4 protein [Planctomycetaceae bacterium]|nr:glycosyltransferase family 4 protein [Planctomycetaceae bacterium]